MNTQQHTKLAQHYQNRYGEMAAYSRSVHGKLTRQEALDYAAMWAKYVAHKREAKIDKLCAERNEIARTMERYGEYNIPMRLILRYEVLIAEIRELVSQS